MTRIDFYILQDQTEDACMRFACRLGLKAARSGNPVHVHVNSAEHATALDELMWDYPKHRFVPHDNLTNDLPISPIHIGCAGPTQQDGLMINLAREIPTFFGRFDRVAEIVVGTTKDQGRERYKYYRDRGYPLHHHDLDSWEA